MREWSGGGRGGVGVILLTGTLLLRMEKCSCLNPIRDSFQFIEDLLSLGAQDPSPILRNHSPDERSYTCDTQRRTHKRQCVDTSTVRVWDFEYLFPLRRRKNFMRLKSVIIVVEQGTAAESCGTRQDRYIDRVGNESSESKSPPDLMCRRLSDCR